MWEDLLQKMQQADEKALARSISLIENEEEGYESLLLSIYPNPESKIIGITGTKGKTTTTFLLEHILQHAGYKTALTSTVKNKILDQEFPAPLTTAQPDYLHQFLSVCVQAQVEYVVMEVAAQALSLHRVEGIEFDGIIFTNFALEHLEFYASMDDYFAAKRSPPRNSLHLYHDCRYGIL